MTKSTTWYLYIIRCKANSLYTGITTDVVRRFEEHQTDPLKGAKYLRGKGPLKLVFKKKIGTKSEAARAEYYIKRIGKAQKERLVEEIIKIKDIIT